MRVRILAVASTTLLSTTRGFVEIGPRRRTMSAPRAKPTEAEIAQRRAAKAALKKEKPPKEPSQPQNKPKERDVVAEAAALRDWGVGEALVDIGANLQSRHSFEEVVDLAERAASAGVRYTVLTGCDVNGSRAGVMYAERLRDLGGPQRLYATAGVHPHDATSWDDATEAALVDLARSPECVALGETGLDYDRMFSPRETQLRVFRAQADLARRLDMPLFVHCRDKEDGEPLGAYVDAVGVLREAGMDPAACCVHCFTGDTQDLDLLLEAGVYVGVTGFVGIAKRSAHTVAALRSRQPDRVLQRLMIETDAPFMLPDKTWLPNAQSKRLGLRGGKNEPAVLPAVCRALAAALSTDDAPVDPATVARMTTRNAHRFFRLEPSP